MKLKGIVRRIDELGRIVLPKEIRTILKIDTEEQLEILVDDDDQIILRKYKCKCIFCNSEEEVTTFKGRNVCRKCLEDIELESK